MNRKIMTLIAMLLVVFMTAAIFAGCTKAPAAVEEPAVEEPAAEDPVAEEPVEEDTTPLVIGYAEFSEKFSPFYADTGYDQDAVALTQIEMLTTDRMGGIIYNAIDGETVSYNGVDYFYNGPCDVSVDYDEASDITTYTIKMREDILFSDGTPATADDIIFTYYVYADPDYVGSTTLGSYNIIGLKNYQTQTTDDIYDKYNTLFADIFAAGEGYTATEADTFTQEQYDLFWNDILPVVWTDDVQSIVDYVLANYIDYGPDYFGHTPEEINASEGMQIAFGMVMWGFGAFNEDNTAFVGAASGTEWDLVSTFPTIADYYNETKLKYGGDPVAYWGTEAADDTSVIDVAQASFISQCAAIDPEMQDGIPNIAGIKKLDDYTVEVKTNGYEAPAVYTICGLQVVPMHYYGDTAQYDYDANAFGHPFGDLSIVREKTANPLGAGPYKFVKFENKVIYYEANEYFYKGVAATKYLQFKTTTSAELAPAVASGTVDGGELTGSRANFEEVSSYNSNAEITGDVISTYKVDNLGYGYIGINADNVSVNGEQASDASKNLRKGIATLLSVYRDVAIDSYYGDAASVINYPISNTSWAAPQPTDPDYKLAFSLDVDGNAIYTSEMTADEKYAAALEASKGYFKAAGYTYDEASGMFTAAPAGAKMSYEAIIPGDGIGDHPSFGILTDTAAALATIGIELKINDPADSNVLWDSMDANTHELWCAAWGATIDPDMYQVYHSSGIVGRGGSDSNHYHIDSAELDEMILSARQSDDQAYRKTVYKQALDLIADYAVEIPTYQRQNCTVFSTERIVLDTITPDMTTFWLWIKESTSIVMASAK